MLRDFSLLRLYPSPCTKVAGAFLPWVMRPGRETDHTPPSSIEVKNVRVVPPFRHMPLKFGQEQRYVTLLKECTAWKAVLSFNVDGPTHRV